MVGNQSFSMGSPLRSVSSHLKLKSKFRMVLSTTLFFTTILSLFFAVIISIKLGTTKGILDKWGKEYQKVVTFCFLTYIGALFLFIYILVDHKQKNFTLLFVPNTRLLALFGYLGCILFNLFKGLKGTFVTWGTDIIPSGIADHRLIARWWLWPTYSTIAFIMILIQYVNFFICFLITWLTVPKPNM